MEIKIMNITPETAAEMLSRNTNNYRNLDRCTAEKYASDMASGRWRQNGETICFDDQGRLVNGQHRLAAIVISGKTLPNCVVATGIPASETGVYDLQRRRSLLQIATAEGKIDQPKTIVIGAINIYLKTASGKKHASPAECLEFYEKEYTLLSAASNLAGHGSRNGILRKSGAVAALFLAMKQGIASTETMDDFCEIVNSGMPSGKGVPDAALMLRKTLQGGITVAQGQEKRTITGGGNFGAAAADITYQAIRKFVTGAKPKTKYISVIGDNKFVDEVKAEESKRPLIGG